jgi:hypothetical protein
MIGEKDTPAVAKATPYKNYSEAESRICGAKSRGGGQIIQGRPENHEPNLVVVDPSGLNGSDGSIIGHCRPHTEVTKFFFLMDRKRSIFIVNFSDCIPTKASESG